MKVEIKDLKIEEDIASRPVVNFTAIFDSAEEENLSIPVSPEWETQEDAIRYCGQVARRRRDDRVLLADRERKLAEMKEKLKTAAVPEKLEIEEAPVITKCEHVITPEQDKRGTLSLSLETNMKSVEVVLVDADGAILSKKEKSEAAGPVTYQPFWDIDELPDSVTVKVRAENNIGEVAEAELEIPLPEAPHVSKIVIASPTEADSFQAGVAIPVSVQVTDQNNLPMSNVPITLNLAGSETTVYSDATGVATAELTASEAGNLLISAGDVSESIPVTVASAILPV